MGLDAFERPSASRRIIGLDQRTPFGQRPIVVKTTTATMKPIHIQVVHVGRSLGGWGMESSKFDIGHILCRSY
jgi:hypothetical protein